MGRAVLHAGPLEYFDLGVADIMPGPFSYKHSFSKLTNKLPTRPGRFTGIQSESYSSEASQRTQGNGARL
jgi:hypothetical protein